MNKSIIIKETKLSSEYKEFLENSGWNSYLWEIFNLCEYYLDRNFLVEFNNPQSILQRWFELAVAKYIYDLCDKHKSIYFYKNSELEKKLKEYKKEKKFQNITRPDFLIKNGEGHFFIEVTHINKILANIYGEILDDGWKQGKVFYYLKGLLNENNEIFYYTETTSPIFCCLVGMNVVRYSAKDFLDAHIFFNREPRLIEKTNLLSSLNKEICAKFIGDGNIDSQEIFYRVLPSWIQSRFKDKKDPNNGKEIRKIEALKKYMSDKNIGYVLALGGAVPDYFPASRFPRAIIDEIFKNASWISGVLVSTNWARWLPDYFDNIPVCQNDDKIEKFLVECQIQQRDYTFYGNPNAEIPLPDDFFKIN